MRPVASPGTPRLGVPAILVATPMGWQNVAKDAPTPQGGAPYLCCDHYGGAWVCAPNMGVPEGAPNNGRNKVWGTPEPYGLAECG